MGRNSNRIKHSKSAIVARWEIDERYKKDELPVLVGESSLISSYQNVGLLFKYKEI